MFSLCYKHLSRQNWMQIAFLAFIKENGFELLKECFYNTCNLTFLIHMFH